MEGLCLDYICLGVNATACANKVFGGIYCRGGAFKFTTKASGVVLTYPYIRFGCCLFLIHEDPGIRKRDSPKHGVEEVHTSCCGSYKARHAPQFYSYCNGAHFQSSGLKVIA